MLIWFKVAPLQAQAVGVTAIYNGRGATKILGKCLPIYPSWSTQHLRSNFYCSSWCRKVEWRGTVELPHSDDMESNLPQRQTAALAGHEGAILAVRFNADGRYCLTCGRDRTLRLWNPHKGLPIKTYLGHGRDVKDVSVSR